jgi:hypothetical protein
LKRDTIKIYEEEYIKGLEICNNNLYGRLILTKGEKPPTAREPHDILSSLEIQQKLISLGNGYFEFVFSTLDDILLFGMLAHGISNLGFFVCLNGYFNF